MLPRWICCLLDTAFGGIEGQRAPLVTLAVAVSDGETARSLWEGLHEQWTWHEPPGTGPDDVPAAPWCASRIEPGALAIKAALPWLADFARGVAWAWIGMRET